MSFLPHSICTEVTLVPCNTWGGQGLLGVSIRFCSFEGAAENVWHVLVSSLSLSHTHTHAVNGELILFLIKLLKSPPFPFSPFLSLSDILFGFSLKFLYC